MRFTPSAMSWRQRLAERAGQLFVGSVAALIAGVAILLLVLSAYYRIPHPPAEVAIMTGIAP
ncbi:hypothetical protein EN836_21895 [Mesorhizobium sp. M1C.F.Ca.ET.193.01.1.1]|uniref:hypothetical protein n=1 Tax=unclassified Mesorhizobium TaxID=325217 RepID=UPI000FD47017|nr:MULTISPECIES: hypothetical protein [unclassified Mesorhizobium]TGS95765.1 hypothetical protein EN820_42615 [bacterium M00.F.Ca.ET.177.01.1.1]RWA73241.1 MAG: hypothetical protein EOQ28_13865 [Mesorhizobium sp.]RWC01756.1 MAG: hypothetical protein EOQ57_12360 [Mesorhizobium sp.]RWG84171.1 MAG: hypothetical protein EOQ70_19870 [Mesorhizobium sp.]RWG86374.1 MAG: hypothetical protein EOQ69_06780 [Mesorhizobium sp.]